MRYLFICLFICLLCNVNAQTNIDSICIKMIATPLNPISVELGNLAFHDAGLTPLGNTSCASCHNTYNAHLAVDGFQIGIGGGVSGGRRIDLQYFPEQVQKDIVKMINNSRFTPTSLVHSKTERVGINGAMTPMTQASLEFGFTAHTYVVENCHNNEVYEHYLKLLTGRTKMKESDLSNSIVDYEMDDAIRWLLSTDYGQYLIGQYKLSKQEIKAKQIFEKDCASGCHGTGTFKGDTPIDSIQPTSIIGSWDKKLKGRDMEYKTNSGFLKDHCKKIGIEYKKDVLKFIKLLSVEN